MKASPFSNCLFAAIIGLGFTLGLDAQEPQKPVRVEPVNLRDFGAVGDGKTDDTVAVQKAIDAACGVGAGNDVLAARKVIIPAGTYRITETISLLPEHYGLQLVGEGSVLPNGPYGSLVPRSAKLLWGGEKGGVLLQARAVKHLRAENLILDGGKSARILVRVNSIDQNNSDESWIKKYGACGAGGFFFQHVKLQHAETGIVLSDDSYICSDTSSFINLMMEKLETGFEARSEQNLAYYFERPDIGYVGTAFKFIGGGSVTAIGVNCHHTDVVFDIEKTGINSGTYELVNVRPEQGARQKGKRPVSLKASGEVNVHMVGLQTLANEVMGPNPDLETPALILGPSANVLVVSSQITAKAARLTGRPDDLPTFLTFENTRFRIHSDPLGAGIERDANSGFRLRDCQITYDEEKDGKYRVLSRKFVPDHLAMPGEAAKPQ